MSGPFMGVAAAMLEALPSIPTMQEREVLVPITIATNGQRCENGPGHCCPYASLAAEFPDGSSQHWCSLFRVALARGEGTGSPTFRTAECLKLGVL